MSPLVICWLLSLALLLGIFFYARNHRGAPAFSPKEIPESFSDFIAIELTRMGGHLSRLVQYARPHGEKVIATGGTFLKKGHDIFIEKIFGRMVIEKGNAASFFLKRIAEHKEALRQKDREGV